MKKTKSWRLVFTGNAGSSRHPSMRRQTVEVWEDTLHVKHAIYEPCSKTDGKSLRRYSFIRIFMYLFKRQLDTDVIALHIWLIFLGYGIADLYMSVNGGGETHIYRFDTKTNALRADLDSIDHLTFEKGSKVVLLFNNYLDKDCR